MSNNTGYKSINYPGIIISDRSNNNNKKENIININNKDKDNVLMAWESCGSDEDLINNNNNNNQSTGSASFITDLTSPDQFCLIPTTGTSVNDPNSFCQEYEELMDELINIFDVHEDNNDIQSGSISGSRSNKTNKKENIINKDKDNVLMAWESCGSDEDLINNNNNNQSTGSASFITDLTSSDQFCLIPTTGTSVNDPNSYCQEYEELLFDELITILDVHEDNNDNQSGSISGSGSRSNKTNKKENIINNNINKDKDNVLMAWESCGSDEDLINNNNQSGSTTTGSSFITDLTSPDHYAQTMVNEISYTICIFLVSIQAFTVSI